MTLKLTGQRYGRLFVVERAGTIGKKSAWLVRCDCGVEKVIRGDHMVRGHCVSCGCFRDEGLSDRATTHGMSKTRPYRIWRDMRNRCHYEKYPEWHLYGGRGIRVCVGGANHLRRFWKTWGCLRLIGPLTGSTRTATTSPAIAVGPRLKSRRTTVGMRRRRRVGWLSMRRLRE